MAAVLIGGASGDQGDHLAGSAGNVFVSYPVYNLSGSGRNLIGDAQIGEFFRVFVAYGVIAVALLLHAWQKHAMARRFENEPWLIKGLE